VAGYSPSPLARKLGIKPHSRLLLLDASAGFDVGDLPAGVSCDRRPTSTPYDTILLFCPMLTALERGFEPAVGWLTIAGGLWTCWPKKASGVTTDLTESALRAFGLRAGLVDIKVCAVDETWSGLRWVRRLTDH
jgi:hypothetical protein